MFTLFFILLMAFLIWNVFQNPADKKSKKQAIKDEEKTASLPDIYIKGKALSSWEKALDGFPAKNDILDVFKYNSSDRSVYLKMLDGRSISCPLSQLDVTFDKMGVTYRFVVTDKRTKFSFYQYDYVFTSDQYNVIIGILLLAGTTHNKAIMGSAHKTLSNVATIVKFLSKL